MILNNSEYLTATEGCVTRCIVGVVLRILLVQLIQGHIDSRRYSEKDFGLNFRIVKNFFPILAKNIGKEILCGRG